MLSMFVANSITTSSLQPARGCCSLPSLPTFHALLIGHFEKWLHNKKRAENDQRLQFALEATGDGVWDWDIVNDKVNYSTVVNPFSLRRRRIGFLAEWKTRSILTNGSPRSALDKHRSGNPLLQSEYRLATRRFLQLGNGTWLGGGKGAEATPLRAVGTGTDISTHRRLEEDLPKAVKMFRLFMQTTPAAVFIKDTRPAFFVTITLAGFQCRLPMSHR